MRRSAALVHIALSACLGLPACAAVPFPIPPVDPSADEADRVAQFERYKLVRDPDRLGYSSQHADEVLGKPSHRSADFTGLFARYDETRRLHEQVTGLSAAGSVFAVSGLAVSGVTIAAAVAENRGDGFLAPPAFIAVAVSGLTLAIAGLSCSILALVKAQRLGPAYNQNLRSELGLSAATPRRQRITWSPTHFGFAW